jgi:hypothetical protein
MRPQPLEVVARPGGPWFARAQRSPRHRHAKARVDRGHVQRGLGLHIEDGRILGRVRDLEHGERAAICVIQAEGPVTFAAQVARVCTGDAEQR